MEEGMVPSALVRIGPSERGPVQDRIGICGAAAGHFDPRHH